MFGPRWFAELYISRRITPTGWQRAHVRRYFPMTPQAVYGMVEDVGFLPSEYRRSWHDLTAGLPSDEWSTRHFVHFMNDEVRLPRHFPTAIDPAKLDDVAKAPIWSRFHRAALLRNLVQIEFDYRRASLADPAFWRGVLRAFARVGRPVLVFGDSHSLVFRQTISAETGLILPINVFCGGGSALGLPNPNSRSGYGAMIERTVAAVAEAMRVEPATMPMCFTFGQVDIEFVHTYRRLKRGDYAYDQAEFDGFCAVVVERYVSWLKSLNVANIAVVGINPPCIDDAFIYECYEGQMAAYVNGNIADVLDEDTFETLLVQFRKLRFPDKVTRTANHRRYNTLLKAAVEAAGLRYIDLFDAMMGEDGCIDPIYACATDGTVPRVGRTGKDIHVGGENTLALKRTLIETIVDGAR